MEVRQRENTDWKEGEGEKKIRKLKNALPAYISVSKNEMWQKTRKGQGLISALVCLPRITPCPVPSLFKDKELKSYYEFLCERGRESTPDRGGRGRDEMDSSSKVTEREGQK